MKSFLLHIAIVVGLSASASDLTVNKVMNSTIEIDSKTYQFQKGKAFKKHSNAASDFTDLSISQKSIALGDLNDDSHGDAVYILQSRTGGTGHFFSLAAVVNEDGKVVQKQLLFLGDRIKIKDLSIRKGLISLSYLEHKENEPMAAEPTELRQEQFILKDGEFQEMAEGAVEIPQISSDHSHEPHFRCTEQYNLRGESVDLQAQVKGDATTPWKIKFKYHGHQYDEFAYADYNGAGGGGISQMYLTDIIHKNGPIVMAVLYNGVGNGRAVFRSDVAFFVLGKNKVELYKTSIYDFKLSQLNQYYKKALKEFRVKRHNSEKNS